MGWVMLTSPAELQLPGRGAVGSIGYEGMPVGKDGGDGGEDGGRSGCLIDNGRRVGGALSTAVAKERTVRNFMMVPTKDQLREMVTKG